MILFECVSGFPDHARVAVTVIRANGIAEVSCSADGSYSTIAKTICAAGDLAAIVLVRVLAEACHS